MDGASPLLWTANVSSLADDSLKPSGAVQERSEELLLFTGEPGQTLKGGEVQSMNFILCSYKSIYWLVLVDTDKTHNHLWQRQHLRLSPFPHFSLSIYIFFKGSIGQKRCNV